jgi:hypothetical protein
MITLVADATVNGKHVHMTVQIENDLGEGNKPDPTDEAIERIYTVMRRETQRFAEISAVNVDDQETAAAEAKRVRDLPADRPVIMAAAGTKDPESVQVLRGSYQVGKKTVHAPKGDR